MQYKLSGKGTVLEEDNDKAGSFLKYIQIRSMKPAEKTPVSKTDMSVR
jgi:hypothetical protein